MSAYSHINDDIRPGLRNRPRGAVTLYHTSSMSRGTSRALNHMEMKDEGRRLNDEMEAEIERVRRRYSKRFLEFVRKQLDGFNLKRHVVVISAAMGSTNLCVVDKRTLKTRAVHDLRVWGERTPGNVIDVLQEIDQYLETTWDWSSYLDRQIITRGDYKV